jgi:hypothetical protein
VDVEVPDHKVDNLSDDINVDLVGLTLIVGLRMWFGRIEYVLSLSFWLL